MLALLFSANSRRGLESPVEELERGLEPEPPLLEQLQVAVRLVESGEELGGHGARLERLGGLDAQRRPLAQITVALGKATDHGHGTA